MSEGRKTSQSHQTPRRDAFNNSRTIDPRKSREAAWRFVEAQENFANPAFGHGPDEFDFPSGSEVVLRHHPSSGRSAF
jgi:hypothetical protein